MNHTEDEKAAEKHCADYFSKTYHKLSHATEYDAFLAGCTHVRTSAEWKILDSMVDILADIAHPKDCTADEDGTRCNHCRAFAALDELDRIRKEGESG